MQERFDTQKAVCLQEETIETLEEFIVYVTEKEDYMSTPSNNCNIVVVDKEPNKDGGTEITNIVLTTHSDNHDGTRHGGRRATTSSGNKDSSAFATEVTNALSDDSNKQTHSTLLTNIHAPTNNEINEHELI